MKKTTHIAFYVSLMLGVLLPASAQNVAVGPDISDPAILVYSETKGWRHNEGIAGADLFFVQAGRDLGLSVFTTSDSTVFHPGTLDRFKLVVFNNVTGDALNEAEEAAFTSWLTEGGGWIGIHGSGDASQSDWRWYQENLIGPTFISHPMAPQLQEAHLDALQPDHPVMAGIPDRWIHTDEWYTFDSRAQDHGFVPLIGLDESTYSPVNTVYGDISDLRMGAGAINHPIVWASCVGQGRSVYSGLGHTDETYEAEVPRRLLSNAIEWVLKRTGTEGEGCSPQARQ